LLHSFQVLNIDLSRYRAAIFDLDGTLVHSERAWESAKIEVARRRGLEPSRTLLDAHIGRDNAGFISELFGQNLSQDTHRTIGEEIDAVADILLPSIREAVPGASELLCTLSDMGIRIAICSSSLRRHIMEALDMLLITSRIETVVSARELPRGKPDPLPYDTTLAKLDLPPQAVCSFEDSLSGAQAAFAAGTSVFAIGRGCTGPKFEFCCFCAESYSELAFP